MAHRPVRTAIDEAMTSPTDLPILEFSDAAAWDAWLAENHGTSAGAWLKLAKKGAPRKTVTYAEALEEAIRYGWIDGRKRGFDEHFWLQRFTVRGPRSKWSQINRQKASELIEQGRMHPAGLAQVEAAQRDGRWDQAYEAQSKATVPPDLQQALDAHPGAKAFFETLTGARRYAFLYRLHHVTKPQARAKRIEDYIALLSAGKTLHD
jgi:uncharacterized protein YdeI (YjbR/CyaY-like superfamily)